MNFAINLSNAIPIDGSKMKLQKAPDEVLSRFKDFEARLNTRPVIAPDPPYATVTRNGKVIAKISNNGSVETSNALGSKLMDILNDGNSRGPELAQKRARQIADALGGEVVKASTAQSQTQWQTRPPVERWIGDPANGKLATIMAPETWQADFLTHSRVFGIVAAMLDIKED